MAGRKLGVAALEQEVVLVLVRSLPAGLGIVLEAPLNHSTLKETQRKAARIREGMKIH